MDIPSRVGGEAQRREALQARGKKRNSRGSGYSGRGHIPGRVDITQRPQIVEDRVGDWEADTIVGAGHRGALVSVVDRASKFTVLHPVSSRSAGEVGEAMMERYALRRDCTYDYAGCKDRFPVFYMGRKNGNQRRKSFANMPI